ncbi:HAMP domain-containing sensor histidine kinase [Amycolatopsis magusensis]|uniref:histidine kinase n=1 Tax=Amycolatopsis magusensis TaxID=882444 RepID=A0ABS4PUT3_9PSEU|nr:HAMP domain-containing sensor histidine kinase [Amycolatopsis magusensis]MBP2183198.1 signal transduction histidine kinase [Amycolatopsis magusensis]
MRARLLVALLVFALVAVAGFAVPLLSATADQRTQQLVISRNADVDRFVLLAQQAVESGDVAMLRAEAEAYRTLYNEPVLVVDANRRPLVESQELSADQPPVRELIEATLRNQAAPAPETLSPWSAEPVVFARPVGPSTRVAGVVLLRASVDTAAAEVGRRWLLTGLGAVAAALAFAALAWLFARWVLKPLHQLEDGVLAVTGGRRVQVPASAGPKELRVLATEFNQMSDAVLESAEQQRRLVADASHQLRNPMAALRLRVDSLAPEVSEDGQRTYRATVTEVERLESLLDGLLALAVAESTATRAAAESSPESADLGSVVAERVDAWRPSAERSEVDIRVGELPDVLLRCPETDLAQVLDVLLDNAIGYGGPEVTLSGSTSDENVVLLVSDNGPGLSEEERAKATERFWRRGGDGAPRGTGLGLAIAERLATAHGGSLSLHDTEPHGLTVRVALPLESP